MNYSLEGKEEESCDQNDEWHWEWQGWDQTETEKERSEHFRMARGVDRQRPKQDQNLWLIFGGKHCLRCIPMQMFLSIISCDPFQWNCPPPWQSNPWLLYLETPLWSLINEDSLNGDPGYKLITITWAINLNLVESHHESKTATKMFFFLCLWHSILFCTRCLYVT